MLCRSGNRSFQIPALVRRGYRAVVIDSGGHGGSTRDERPYNYELMASDVLAVMYVLQIEKAGLVGWSDGAAGVLSQGHRLLSSKNCNTRLRFDLILMLVHVAI